MTKTESHADHCVEAEENFGIDEQQQTSSYSSITFDESAMFGYRNEIYGVSAPSISARDVSSPSYPSASNLITRKLLHNAEANYAEAIFTPIKSNELYPLLSPPRGPSFHTSASVASSTVSLSPETSREQFIHAEVSPKSLIVRKPQETNSRETAMVETSPVAEIPLNTPATSGNKSQIKLPSPQSSALDVVNAIIACQELERKKIPPAVTNELSSIKPARIDAKVTPVLLSKALSHAVKATKGQMGTNGRANKVIVQSNELFKMPIAPQGKALPGSRARNNQTNPSYGRANKVIVQSSELFKMPIAPQGKPLPLLVRNNQTNPTNTKAGTNPAPMRVATQSKIQRPIKHEASSISTSATMTSLKRKNKENIPPVIPPKVQKLKEQVTTNVFKGSSNSSSLENSIDHIGNVGSVAESIKFLQRNGVTVSVSKAPRKHSFEVQRKHSNEELEKYQKILEKNNVSIVRVVKR